MGARLFPNYVGTPKVAWREMQSLGGRLIVIIKERNVKRGQWILGLVATIYPSEGGIVRSHCCVSEFK